MTNWTWAKLAPRTRWMVGRATLTTKLSKTAMKAPPSTSARVSQRSRSAAGWVTGTGGAARVTWAMGPLLSRRIARLRNRDSAAGDRPIGGHTASWPQWERRSPHRLGLVAQDAQGAVAALD